MEVLWRGDVGENWTSHDVWEIADRNNSCGRVTCTTYMNTCVVAL